ncbi:MAG: hypothetical protein WBI57_10185, partial [Desulfobacterales bacterium]
MTKKKRSIGVVLKRLFKWLLPLAVLMAGGILLYCWHLSSQIDQRFSGRRWRIPSKVFSDTTLLYP